MLEFLNVSYDKNNVDVNSKLKSEQNQDSYADWKPSYVYKDNDYSSSDDSDNEDNDEESVGDSSRITPVSRKLTLPIQTQFNGNFRKTSRTIFATPQGLNMTSQSNLNRSHDHDIVSENEHISESSDFEVLFENDEVEEDDSVVNVNQSTMGRKSVESTLCPSDNGGLRGSSEDVDDTFSVNECGKKNEQGERTFEILFIQMDYCEKQTLRNLIDYGNLMTNPEEIWRLFREMLASLDYIHKKAMIHWDINSLNIFIDAHNNVKIGDFSLATIDVNLSDHNGSVTNPDEVLSQGGGDLTYVVNNYVEQNGESSVLVFTYTYKEAQAKYLFLL
uniref:Protein kinase domain-containing protein n=1 Tax=Strongyloides papillosus TaxID=174720 RepID=A0A0N5CI96_STREA